MAWYMHKRRRRNKKVADMDWDKLTNLSCGADAGSLTHAGDNCICRNRRVSRQVRALEESAQQRCFTAMRAG